MALRNLTNWNDIIFRKTSRPIDKLDGRLWTLLDDMRENLEKVGGIGGIGLAAVYVGILRRVVVILDENHENGVIELINRVIQKQARKRAKLKRVQSRPVRRVELLLVRKAS